MLIEFTTGELKPKELNYGKLKKLGFENHNLKISESFDGMNITASMMLMISRKQSYELIYEDKLEKDIENIIKEVNKLKEQCADLNKLKKYWVICDI